MMGLSGAPAGDKISPAKRKQVDTLDGSEDEAEAEVSKKTKKPRKHGNLAGQRTALYENISKQMTGKIAGLQAKVSEATKVVNEEKGAPRPLENTDITTRKLYTNTLTAAMMVQAWQDPSSLLVEIQTFNEAAKQKGEDDVVVDTSVQETISVQSPMLCWLLKNGCASLGVERGAFLRCQATTQAHVESVSRLALEEPVLDKAKLVWRRMLNCITQLEIGLKKASQDVSKHVHACAAAAERLEKKRKAKEAKEQEQAHFKSVQDKVKIATADGANMPGVIKLPQEHVTAVRVFTCGAIPGDADLSEPFIISKENTLLQAWSSSPVVLQVLKNFGSRYKKVPSLQETGKVTQPYVVKGGKEQTEKLFTDLTANLKEKKLIVDVSECAANWMSTSWMFGLEPKRTFVAATPNSAAYFRCLAYGEVEMFCIPALAFCNVLKDNAMPVPTKMSELEEVWVFKRVREMLDGNLCLQVGRQKT